jgi:tol-pal system protein YbgF
MRAAGLAVSVGGALLLAACATTPQVDPVQVRLDDLDTRVGRIDRIVSNQSLIQMTQRVDALQSELRTLSGRIEELQNENATLRKQQRDLYADLDKRLTVAATAPAAVAATSNPAPMAAGATPPTTTPAAPTGGDEQALYNRAYDQLKAKNYAGAVEGFRSLAAAFPNGLLADNTQYWLGEAYYVTEEYDHAAAAFQRVLSTWPNSRKAPDALLKLGYTQMEQNKLAAARTSLQQVVTRFPDSAAAKLATERLAKLPKQ